MRGFFKKGFSETENQFFGNQEPLILMGRGHSGTRVFSLFCHHLGYNMSAENKVKTGDASNLKFTKSIKRIALDYLRHGRQDEQINSLKRAISKYHKDLKGEKELWGWKFPETYLIGPLVHEICPKARYIHIIRDGRDLAFKRHLTDRVDRGIGNRILSELGVISRPHYIQAGLSWKYQVDAFDKWKVVLKPEHLHEVRFEDFIMDPKKEGGRICRFLGTDLTEQASEFLLTKINTKKIAQYSQEKKSHVLEVEQLISDTLQRWSYSLSTSE